MTVTYLDIARSYERFLGPDVGQEGSNHEPRWESVPRTGRTVIDLDPEEQEKTAHNREGAEQARKKRPREASQEDVP
eukprot:16315275-Heterocapsa_arctica.AAC.1